MLPQLKLIYNKVKNFNFLKEFEKEVKEEEKEIKENIEEQTTNERILEVYFNNFSMNYKNRDVHFSVKFEAFFEDGTNLMERTITYGSERSINKVSFSIFYNIDSNFLLILNNLIN